MWLRGVQEQDTQSVNLWKPCVEGGLAEPAKCLTQTGSCSLLLVLSFMQGKWEMVIASKGKSDGSASLIAPRRGFLTKPENNAGK